MHRSGSTALHPRQSMVPSIGFHGTAEAGAMKLFADWAINCTVDRLIGEEICRSVSRQRRSRISVLNFAHVSLEHFITGSLSLSISR